MQTNRSTLFLRRVLAADAISAGAMGLMLLLLSAPIESLTLLPAKLLREAAIVLLPFAAFVAWLAMRQQPARGAVWAVIIINAIWVIESVFLLLTGWVQPNALGYAFVIGQAVVVGVFAELEWLGLRKQTSVA